MIDKYNYNDEPSGRVDTLAMALDKCQRLEKQLSIAKEALETIKLAKLKKVKEGYSFGILEAISYKMIIELAKNTLNRIKELEK